MQYFPFQLTVPVAAGDSLHFDVAGEFIRYDEETTGAAQNKIRFKTDAGDLITLKPGQAAEVPRFKRVSLENLAGVSTLTGSIAIGRGVIWDSNIVGSVLITNVTASATYTHTAKQVTNASQSLLAANASRKYLRVENQDAALTLFIRCNGTAATADNASIRLLPGEVYEPATVPVGEVRGIMSAATAANNVQVVEG